MRREITIKCTPRNAEARADMPHGARAGLVELERHRKRLGIDGFAPPPFPATSSRTRQSRQGPFPHEIAFEFCKRPRDLKKELPRGCGGINRLDDTLEANRLPLTVTDCNRNRPGLQSTEIWDQILVQGTFW